MIWYKRFTWYSLIGVYLIIVAGGVVRCTGSGMGCPDWPKCFGLWIPPTDSSQLPPNYVVLYNKGGTLDVSFNVYKTWTEYINRLIGALTGLMVLGMVFSSLKLLAKQRKLFFLSLVVLFFMGFQGWLGAKVVDTNLAPYMVTVHMLFAMFIIMLLIYITHVTNKTSENSNAKGSIPLWVIWSAIIFLFLQILIGTQVRQQIDTLFKLMGGLNREVWISNLNYIFVIHRVFAYVVSGLILFLSYMWYKNGCIGGLIPAAIVVMELISGFVLTYFAVPALIQPVHLFLSSVLLGILFKFLLDSVAGSIRA